MNRQDIAILQLAGVDVVPREFGPPTYMICDECNHDNHYCRGCGTDLTHAEANRGGHCPN